MYSLTLLIIQKCHNLYSSESDFEQRDQDVSDEVPIAASLKRNRPDPNSGSNGLTSISGSNGLNQSKRLRFVSSTSSKEFPVSSTSSSSLTTAANDKVGNIVRNGNNNVTNGNGFNGVNSSLQQFTSTFEKGFTGRSSSSSLNYGTGDNAGHSMPFGSGVTSAFRVVGGGNFTHSSGGATNTKSSSSSSSSSGEVSWFVWDDNLGKISAAFVKDYVKAVFQDINDGNPWKRSTCRDIYFKQKGWDSNRTITKEEAKVLM